MSFILRLRCGTEPSICRPAPEELVSDDLGNGFGDFDVGDGDGGGGQEFVSWGKSFASIELLSELEVLASLSYV